MMSVHPACHVDSASGNGSGIRPIVPGRGFSRRVSSKALSILFSLEVAGILECYVQRTGGFAKSDVRFSQTPAGQRFPLYALYIHRGNSAEL